MAAALAAAFGLLPVAAQAHARLLASDPSPGALLQSAPASVRLSFSEPVTRAGRGISIYAPDGRLAQSGLARAAGVELTTGVRDAGPGTYTVIWTVVSSDTHPSRGQLTFSVGHDSPPRAPGLGSRDVGLVSVLGLVLQTISRWLHFAGFALGFGVATYCLLVSGRHRALRLASLGVLLLVLSEPLALLAQTASLDPSQTFDGDALVSMLASPFGRVFGLRAAAAVLLWAVLGALSQAPWLRWAVPVLGAALAAVDGAAAHAIPALPAPGAIALIGVHVGAMGFWVGGLVAYLVQPDAGFRRLLGWTLALLLLSGVALALLHFSSPSQLISTPYGLSLLAKLPLVGAALALGYLSYRRWELPALAGVLLAAALLLSLPPPR